MKKLYDMCVVTGKYSQNGQTKSRYENIGAIYKNNDGSNFAIIKAHFNPAGINRKEGSQSIIVSLFPPRDKDDNSQSSSRDSSSQSQDFDNNFDNNDTPIPF